MANTNIENQNRAFCPFCKVHYVWDGLPRQSAARCPQCSTQLVHSLHKRNQVAVHRPPKPIAWSLGSRTMRRIAAQAAVIPAVAETQPAPEKVKAHATKNTTRKRRHK